jgi:hypothetical protein
MSNRKSITERMHEPDVAIHEIEDAMDWYDHCFENYRHKMSMIELGLLIEMKRAARSALTRQCFGK